MMESHTRRQRALRCMTHFPSSPTQKKKKNMKNDASLPQAVAASGLMVTVAFLSAFLVSPLTFSYKTIPDPIRHPDLNFRLLPCWQPYDLCAALHFHMSWCSWVYKPLTFRTIG